jgi:hypothetical protein
MDSANVILFSILGGRFASSLGLTDSSGYFTTTFLAPNTALIKNIRIVASASMAGFADGSDYQYLTVQPPVIVNVNANPDIIMFEATTNVTVTATYNGAPAIGANITVSSNSTGSFDQIMGVTDANGTCTFVFNAPNVALITRVKIVASASVTGLAEGSGYEYLIVQPPLIVRVTANPDVIKSKATANVSVRATYSGVPVAGASLTVSSNSSGSFDHTTGVTTANGQCTFVFTAPQTPTPLQIVINATATKTGYVAGQGQLSLTVEPKVLLVQISSSSAALNSETTSNITVVVVYDANPVSNATVVLSSDEGGGFTPKNATTDANGQCTFVFTAPKVISPSNITITATATRVGYARGLNQTVIAVNLGALSVQLSAYPATANSKATSHVTVYVSYNEQPVANATVNMSSGIVQTATTNKNGDCTFTFTAPVTSIEFQRSITVTATESGYLSGQGEISLDVKPASSPLLSLPVMIAIIAVVLAMAIVLILIKLQVIVISSEGE